MNDFVESFRKARETVVQASSEAEQTTQPNIIQETQQEMEDLKEKMDSSDMLNLLEEIVETAAGDVLARISALHEAQMDDLPTDIEELFAYLQKTEGTADQKSAGSPGLMDMDLSNLDDYMDSLQDNPSEPLTPTDHPHRVIEAALIHVSKRNLDTEQQLPKDTEQSIREETMLDLAQIVDQTHIHEVRRVLDKTMYREDGEYTKGAQIAVDIAAYSQLMQEAMKNGLNNPKNLQSRGDLIALAILQRQKEQQLADLKRRVESMKEIAIKLQEAEAEDERAGLFGFMGPKQKPESSSLTLTTDDRLSIVKGSKRIDNETTILFTSEDFTGQRTPPYRAVRNLRERLRLSREDVSTTTEQSDVTQSGEIRYK